MIHNFKYEIFSHVPKVKANNSSYVNIEYRKKSKDNHF